MTAVTRNDRDTALPRPKAPRWRLTYHRARKLWGFSFAVPFLVFFVFFTLVPYVMSIWLSVVNWQPVLGTTFEGLGNYAYVLKQRAFLRSLQNSFTYALMVVPGRLVVSLLAAILIVSLAKNWQSFFQAVFYLPGVISGLAVSIIWRFVFDNEIGVLNFFMTKLGFEKVAWLGDPKTALASLALMALVGGYGGSIIIFSAALLGIPQSLYDAASVDGASFWRRHWNVTLPLLTPAILYVLVMGTLGALQVFVPVYALTGGGPVYATTTVGYYIYSELIFMNRTGTAAAGGMILLVLTIGLTALQFRRFSQVVEV